MLQISAFQKRKWAQKFYKCFSNEMVEAPLWLKSIDNKIITFSDSVPQFQSINLENVHSLPNFKT